MGRITIELIPRTCFGSNVRSLFKQKYWDILRRASYEKAGHVCEVCKASGKDQGYRHNVECHEIWTYDDKTRTQRLDGLISLCPKCHQVKHFGRASAIGKQAEVFLHMESVNDWNHHQCVQHAAESMTLWLERSKYKWYIDLSVLHEEYELPKKLITEAEKKRK